MEFVKVDGIPESQRNRAAHFSLKSKLERFLAMNVQYARVDYTRDEYSSPTGALHSLSACCNMYDFPAYAILRNGDIYLIRTDM